MDKELKENLLDDLVTIVDRLSASAVDDDAVNDSAWAVLPSILQYIMKLADPDL